MDFKRRPAPATPSVTKTQSSENAEKDALQAPRVSPVPKDKEIVHKEKEIIKGAEGSPDLPVLSRFQRSVQSQVRTASAEKRKSFHAVAKTANDSQNQNNRNATTPLLYDTWRLEPRNKKSFPSLGDIAQEFLFLSCPKCHKDSVVHHKDGVFACLSCYHHGNTSLHPRSYRGTWLAAWESFLEHFTKNSDNTQPPAELRPHHPDEEKPLPLNVPRGVFAPAFVDNILDVFWHVFIHDNNGVLRDAHIWLGEDTNSQKDPWFRYDQPAYPWGVSFVQSGRVILVADIRDQLALSQSDVGNVLVLPPNLDSRLPTSEAWRVMEFMEGVLSEKAREVVLCFPSTPVWRVNEEEIGRRLDKERCFRARYIPFYDDGASFHEYEKEEGARTIPEENTLFSFFEAYGPEDTQSVIDMAHPFPVAGLHELDDIDEQFELLYETGLQPGARTGWPSMDARYTVKTGQWSLVTGIPGHGKSSWLDGLLVNLATHHGWRFGLFSPENQPIERHFAGLMEKKLCKPFSEGPTPRISHAEKNKTKVWLNEKFKVILPVDDGLWTLDSVLNLAKTLIMRYGIRGLVIDPWNELDHSIRSNITETTYISECLTKIRRFARLYDIHIWIVAHPTKLEKRADGKYPVPTPYDVSGGAHWRNKADNAITVYRNVDEDDSDITDVYIQKIRSKEVGSIGMVSLRSDRASGAFIDDIDQNKRQLALQQGRYEQSSYFRLATPRDYPKGPSLDLDTEF